MSDPFRVLLVDDETQMLKALNRALGTEMIRAGAVERPLEIGTASSGPEALVCLKARPADVVVSDIRMPGGDGLELLKSIRAGHPQTDVVLITAYATVESAVEAMKAGAADYLIKPFKVDELLLILQRLAERGALLNANETLTRQVRESAGLTAIVYQSEAMKQVMARVRKVAQTESTVFLRGESGTGKDLLARAIHFESRRASGPLVKANCAAIPEGLLESDLFGHVKGAFTGATEKKTGRFEVADGGTIFLDEIGDMSLSTQVKLLRVLQEREFERVGSTETKKVDVRVIAATNRDLDAALNENKFREDLYYRLNVISIEIPPLRDRREDIPALIEHFVEEKSRRLGLSRKAVPDEIRAIFMAHNWPGNVRELENAIEHALVMGESDRIETVDLPPCLQPGKPRTSARIVKDDTVSLEGLTLEEMEEILINRALRLANGNQSKAAEMLGITRRALGYRREKGKEE